MQHPTYGPPPHPAAQWYPPPPAPRTGGRGLAITALVLSGLALLGVLIVGVGLLVMNAPSDEGDSVTGPLTGQLTASPHGGRVLGATLAEAVTDRITQDGGEVSRMDCPVTPKAGQGIVTVCHGVISMSDWAVIVYFEDTDGRFTLEPL
ncbi:hypothetical protein [Jatrophihabitans sp.]|uniref:hypothetical protein n=1 Tax=Jatrophihabitans sp. TaxID=1932789 RepID=UPI002D1A4819|nr:hypothetical protein [Jatrophihabitans sp.]